MNVDDWGKWTRAVAFTKTATSTGATATTVYLTPPARKLWLIVYAGAYHAAGANRNCHWRYYDRTTPAGLALCDAQALATATMWPLSRDVAGLPFISNLVPCDGYKMLAWQWTAAGAGEVGTINGIALELPIGAAY